MAGTKAGAAKALARILEKDPDHFKKIGAKGGAKGAKDGTIKGFAKDPERAREAGKVGGTISRRGKKNASQL